MTIKNDLKDIGYFMITPLPYRFEGVNYKRASTQVTIGALALQFGLVGAVLFGPLIVNKIGDLKDKMLKKSPKK